ncbi:epididymal-specific lipocalin-8 [Diceros bicornis minor]|uniref:epididymal-specific lipocalin-8 n=1 Tax=Diceros bicornis minor TaxID=77932 RepID=UPI0026E96964|nr:epididymal-specific lipocalin-8 [Diceros bicornis minor]
MEAGLLSAVLGLVMVQVETAGQDLDLQKIAGFWREVGVASNQNLALKTPKGLEAWFLSLSGAALTVTAAHNSSGSCETEKIVGLGIDISGKFVFPGHREIRVVDTDYKRYAILRVSLLWQDKDFHVLKYFTRSLEDEFEPGFWRFREMTADTGLYLVARHGRCAKLLKEPETLGLLPHFVDRETEAPGAMCFAQSHNPRTLPWPNRCPPGPSQAGQPPEPCPLCRRS